MKIRGLKAADTVILSKAKDLIRPSADDKILRCAQNDQVSYPADYNSERSETTLKVPA
jgi:hypothetical protein